MSLTIYQLSVLCVFLIDLGMTFLHKLFLILVFGIRGIYILSAVVCQQYEWACSAPKENGQRCIPSVMDRVGVIPTTTDGSMLYIYRVGDSLSASCYGPVTAIEYCYRYNNNDGSGQTTFNWTVLILEDTGSNDFVINNKHFIVSHPLEGSATCTSGGLATDCCDVTTVESFDLPMNFIFGVTESESAQGNTHGATLLGYEEAAHLQLRVSTIQVAKGNILTLPVGSTFHIPGGAVDLRGLRMLWFIVGKHQYYS